MKFRKILNPIDLTVIIVITLGILAVSIFVYSKVFKSQKPFTKKTEIEIVLRIPSVDPMVVRQIKKGDSVTAKQPGVNIGDIVQVKSNPAIVVTQTSEGKLVLAKSPFFKDVYLYLKSNAVTDDSGYTIGNYHLLINNEETFLTSNATLDGRLVRLKIN